MKTRLLLGLIITLAAVPAWAEEATPRRMEVYPLGFCDPGTAAEAARAIVGEGGTVVADDKQLRLLVVASDDEHRQLAQILQKLNVPPKNIRIEVRFQGQGVRRDTGAGLEGQGQVIVRDGNASTRIRVTPHVQHQVTETSSDVTEMLLVASGREGRLHVGEEIPYLEWFVDYGIRCGVLAERIHWQKVGAYLLVEPTVIGEGPMIRVRLTPELSGTVEGNPQHVRFARAATEVVVRDGETFRLGGLNKDEEFYSHFLVGFGRSADQQSLDILLTPRIAGP